MRSNILASFMALAIYSQFPFHAFSTLDLTFLGVNYTFGGHLCSELPCVSNFNINATLHNSTMAPKQAYLVDPDAKANHTIELLQAADGALRYASGDFTPLWLTWDGYNYSLQA